MNFQGLFEQICIKNKVEFFAIYHRKEVIVDITSGIKKEVYIKQ